MHSTLSGLSSLNTLLIASELPLVRESLAALAKNDTRFSQVTPWSGSFPTLNELSQQLPSRYTAIIDARFPIGPLEKLWVEKPPVSLVVLANSSSTLLRATLNRLLLRLGGLEPAVLDWGSEWKELAGRLQVLPPGTAPMLRQDTANSSKSSPQPPTTAQRSRLLSLVPITCPVQEAAVLSTLSRREVEVLQLVGEGHSVRECAEQLHLAVSTVDNHKSRLMKKTGSRKSTDLVRFAIRSRLIDA